MIRDKKDIPCRIIGVGDAGCAVVDGLAEDGFRADHCVMVNGSHDDRQESRCSVKITLAEHKPPGGPGYSHDPVWCREAALAGMETIEGALKGSRLNIIVAGMGGGVGNSAGPVIAGVGKGMGALTIAVVSGPFPFEGGYRVKRAVTGIDEMTEAADMTLLILYDYLLEMLSPKTTMREAFETASKTLSTAVKELHGWLTHPSGAVDGDFESKKSLLKDAGPAYLGLGAGNSMIDAMGKAISCPLLGGDNLQRAGMLFGAVRTGPNTTLAEVQEAFDLLTGTIDNEKAVIALDVTCGGEAGVFLIAAGQMDQARL